MASIEVEQTPAVNAHVEEVAAPVQVIDEPITIIAAATTHEVKEEEKISTEPTAAGEEAPVVEVEPKELVPAEDEEAEKENTIPITTEPEAEPEPVVVAREAVVVEEEITVTSDAVKDPDVVTPPPVAEEAVEVEAVRASLHVADNAVVVEEPIFNVADPKSVEEVEESVTSEAVDVVVHEEPKLVEEVKEKKSEKEEEEEDEKKKVADEVEKAVAI